jgi:HK97 family phage major capsid protein
MGHDIVLAPEMSYNNSSGRSKPGAIFGALDRGYLKVNRIDTQILRDPYTQATKGLIRFVARRRVGGKVILPEAIKVLTLHA